MPKVDQIPAGLWALLASVVLLAACHRTPLMLAPDYEVDFGCKTVPSAARVARFMTTQGFSSFDEEGARRKRGPSFYALQIDGHDSRRRMLDIIGLRKPASFGGSVSYRLTLTGPPPTKHDTSLESTVALFVREDLNCRIQAVHRYANTRASAGLFDSVLADELARIHALK